MPDFEEKEVQGKEREKTEKRLEGLLLKAEHSSKKKLHKKAAGYFQDASGVAWSLRDTKAMDYSLEAAGEYSLKGDMFNAGWSYRNASLLAFRFGDIAHAESFATRALDYLEKGKGRFSVQWVYTLLGDIEEKKGDHPRAFEFYQKAAEIKSNSNIEEKLGELMKRVPDLLVSQEPLGYVMEGWKARFRVRVTNTSNSLFSGIRLMSGSRVIKAIDSLAPRQHVLFSVDEPVEGPEIDPPVTSVSWKAKDKETTERLRTAKIAVRPDVEIRPYISRIPVVGRRSLLTVMVRNNSQREVDDVSIRLEFPGELGARSISGSKFSEILPGNEKGFVFGLHPAITGKVILRPVIIYRDSKGRAFENNVKPFILEEILEQPEEAGKRMYREPETALGREKRLLESSVRPWELSETEFIAAKREMMHATKGISFRDIDAETVAGHVEMGMKPLYPVSRHSLEDERLLLFSGETGEGKFLVTVAIRERAPITSLAMDVHSYKEPEPILERLLAILEHTIVSMEFSPEVQHVEVKETFNIIDSIVQRSRIGSKWKKMETEDSSGQ